MTAEWIPVFTSVLRDEEILKPTYMVSSFGWCKLCEATLPYPSERGIRRHVAGHRRELEIYRKQREKENVQAATKRLTMARKERALASGQDERATT